VKTISLLMAIMPIMPVIPMLAGQAGVIPAKGPAQSADPAKGPSQGAAVPAKVAPKAVYIVSRATTAESRALFSARLLKMNATKLHWYEDASVVRVQISPKVLETLRADRDVVLVLFETGLSETVLAETTLSEKKPGQAGAHEAPAQLSTPLPSEPAPATTPAPAIVPPGQAAASSPGGASPQSGCSGPALPQPAGTVPPPGPLPPMPMGSTGMAPMGAPPMGSVGLGMGPGVGLVDALAGGVTQHLLNRPPSCKISVAKNSVKFGAAGGEGLIEINASGSCAWQAQASVSWIKILSGSGVSGSGIVSYSVEPADGKPRSGAIWIATSPAGSPIKGNASQVVTQTK
jgi:hypothetical protein